MFGQQGGGKVLESSIGPKLSSPRDLLFPELMAAGEEEHCSPLRDLGPVPHGVLDAETVSSPRTWRRAEGWPGQVSKPQKGEEGSG